MRLSITNLFLAVFFVSCLAQADSHKFKVQVIDDSFDAPWAVVTGPDGRLFITDKTGKIFVFKNDKKVAEVTGIPKSLAIVGQGGLLDIAFHPQFEENNFVYLSYSTAENAIPSNGFNTRVSRFVLKNYRLSSEKVLVQGGFGTDGAHFGCRLTFGKDGKLYATFGERHHKEKAQELEYLNGKTVRINDDGSIPKDNPFFDVEGARKEIYSLGHRNAQGMDMHPLTGDLYISEHGPSGYDASLPKVGPVGKADEVNRIEKAGNYGWPKIFGTPDVLPWTEAMKNYVEENAIIMPYREYTVPDGIAPSGVAFYTGDKFPNWKNSLMVTALRGYIVRISMDNKGQFISEEKLEHDNFSRARDVVTGADGSLYLITGVGELLKIIPQN